MRYEKLFVIGHREADDRLIPKLHATVEQLIIEEHVWYSPSLYPLSIVGA